jgi:hypothetical protein
VELKVVQEMLGHSSIVLTADTYKSVLPDAAHAAAEKVAALIIKAGCLVPGTRRRRRRQASELPGAQPRTPDAASPGRRSGRGHIRPGRSAARTGGAAPACDDQPSLVNRTLTRWRDTGNHPRRSAIC